jgi:hypothetical protein
VFVAEWGMATKFVRAPNSAVLITGGIALVLLAARGAWSATRSNPYSIPLVPWVAMHGALDAVLGTALLFVALRKSRFAGTTAVIVATFLTFSIAMKAFGSAAFGLAFHLGWADAFDLAIIAAIVGPLLFPWNSNTNRPVFFLTGLTFGTLTLLFGSLAVLARL